MYKITNVKARLLHGLPGGGKSSAFKIFGMDLAGLVLGAAKACSRSCRLGKGTSVSNQKFLAAACKRAWHGYTSVCGRRAILAQSQGVKGQGEALLAWTLKMTKSESKSSMSSYHIWVLSS